jgi:glycosyltransferase involved in cell wall biosynthesis
VEERVIRLYGTTQENGSYARVTEGMRRALEAHGDLAGFVPLDTYDREETYPGWDAETAVYVGRQKAVSLMTTIGEHQRRYVLLPPNSTWMPDELLDHVAKYATHLIAPSSWAEQVLWHPAEARGMKTSLWLHGVDPEAFRPDSDAFAQRLAEFQDGQFSVLHLTSTEAERKGTRELAEAWARLVTQGKLGSRPTLTVVGNPYEGGRLKEDIERVTRDVRPTLRWIARGVGMGPRAAAKFYQAHHVVCQPSRGEGFGLVPLEARACGVPVVATACTGHAAHMTSGDAGVLVVPTGELAPIDDGPAAMAPTVSAEAIVDALGTAAYHWATLANAARNAAATVHVKWNWEFVTSDWLRRNQP